MANSKDVLCAVPSDERVLDVNQIDLSKDAPATRALGVIWLVGEDCFGFEVRVPDQNQPVTRRKVLSLVCSLYDSFGFIAPVVLEGKRLLRELSVLEGHGWDDEVPSEIQSRWDEWVESIRGLDSLRVPRCLRPSVDFAMENAQLHVFADASTGGYGAVAYLRLTSAPDQVKLTFIAGKARLSPLKIQTIPKLELTAATVALRMSCAIVKEMQLPIRVVYHVDSLFVWHCIRNETRRFPIFVANRLQLIREFSEPSQWRYVPSQMNPADDASRGLSAKALLSSAMWLEGPEFLLKPESEWPVPPDRETDGEESVSVSAVSNELSAPSDPSELTEKNCMSSIISTSIN
jgi:hypothetical protein